MNKIAELVIDIQSDIDRGELSFQQIAIKHGVSLRDVDAMAVELMEQDPEQEPYEPSEDAYLDAAYEDRYCVEDF